MIDTSVVGCNWVELPATKCVHPSCSLPHVATSCFWPHAAGRRLLANCCWPCAHHIWPLLATETHWWWATLADHLLRMLATSHACRRTLHSWHHPLMVPSTHGTIHSWHHPLMVPSTHGTIHPRHPPLMVPSTRGTIQVPRATRVQHKVAVPVRGRRGVGSARVAPSRGRMGKACTVPGAKL
jgi:hypothetical protein